MLHLLGFALIIYACFYGSYANPLWKLNPHLTPYANGLFRAIIGIPAWVATIYLLIGNLGSFILWLVITLACCVPSALKLRADGMLCFKAIHLLIMASMGTYARIILAMTIIGLFVTRKTKRAAEIGWQGAAAEWMNDNARKNRSSGPSVSQILHDDVARREQEAAEEAARRQPEVEVWLEQDNGSMKKAQVNSDGSMYKDPDSGDWVKIVK